MFISHLSHLQHQLYRYIISHESRHDASLDPLLSTFVFLLFSHPLCIANLCHTPLTLSIISRYFTVHDFVIFAFSTSTIYFQSTRSPKARTIKEGRLRNKAQCRCGTSDLWLAQTWHSWYELSSVGSTKPALTIYFTDFNVQLDVETLFKNHQLFHKF